MRIKNLHIFVLLCLFGLGGCLKRVPQASTKDQQKIAYYAENLSGVRPVVNGTSEVTPTEKVAKKPSQKHLEPQSDNQKIENALAQLAKKNEKITDAQGYRLQIFTGNQRTDFELAKSYILQYFPELELYESYSQPTYRLKVGDFMKKADAERYYANLVGRFSTAKIIVDKIDLKKSFNIN